MRPHAPLLPLLLLLVLPLLASCLDDEHVLVELFGDPMPADDGGDAGDAPDDDAPDGSAPDDDALIAP